MDTFKAFFAEYGYSFLMMVVIGFVIAIITEITLKKALNWLEGKLAGHDRLIAILNFVRTILIRFQSIGTKSDIGMLALANDFGDNIQFLLIKKAEAVNRYGIALKEGIGFQNGIHLGEYIIGI